MPPSTSTGKPLWQCSAETSNKIPGGSSWSSESSERLSPRELRAISAHAVSCSDPEHSVVVSEGDATNSLYVVLEGRVKIFLADASGREIVLGEAGPGEYSGEMTLDGGPRSASVVTIDAARLSVIPQADFKRFVTANPAFAFHLVQKLIARVRTLTDNVKSPALLRPPRPSAPSPARLLPSPPLPSP